MASWIRSSASSWDFPLLLRNLAGWQSARGDSSPFRRHKMGQIPYQRSAILAPRGGPRASGNQ